ncbi:hypothetical protein Rsub_12569 [Raphidocelis subcapitata]|uniref:ADP/ATP translocase n=1 Tax=Raphidocelis subcapitata TaxID=307507 RepID=A0A2V0PJC1_9CHLO|nr:hypothetical protein Rsub_12569 [Raphidocelis subcapitata]|eukprot:GBF99816.1 hypothetical protein Rsub_12569 [Raphidocelis subcapitata]
MTAGSADADAAAADAAAEKRRRPRLVECVSVSDLAAGLATSALYTTATYPVHRVKVLLQTQDANPRIVSGSIARYSFVASFARLLREQGPSGLWRGNTPYLLRHVPSIALSFTLKDGLREALLPLVGESGTGWRVLAVNALSGGLAGVVSLALVYPFEFATVRMAADLGNAADRQYGTTMRATWLQAVRKEGLLSTYRGLPVAASSMALYKALYFGLYDSAKPYVLGADAPPATTPLGLALRTGLAGATTFTAASVSYPLDIIRKRLIVDTAAEAPQYGGSFRRCVAEIARREGVRGFYRFYFYDMGFRVFGGLVLVGYDLFQDMLRQRQQKEFERRSAGPAGSARALGDLAEGGGKGGDAPGRQLRLQLPLGPLEARDKR